MEDLLPSLFRTLSAILSKYGLVVLIPLVVVIVWAVFPRGLMRYVAVLVVGTAIVVFCFGDHPAIAPINSAIGAVLYNFRSMLR